MNNRNKEDVKQAPSQLNLFIKPVGEYLINGPIPAEDLAFLDFIDAYLEMGKGDTILDVHFMLERVSTKGAPDWWKGSIAQFEEEFHYRYQKRIDGLDKNLDTIWNAAQDEVNAGRLSPLPDIETKEQLEQSLSQGKKRLEQAYAVELLLDMWVEALGL